MKNILSRTIVIALASLSLMGMPAFAADEPAEPAAAEKPNPNKRVCKKVRSTATRIPQKVCMRQRQWDELVEQGQATSEQMRNASENRALSGQ